VGCRKKKAVHKATTTDDKRLQSTLKRLNVNTIPSIEEVMLIKDDMVTVFNNPKGTVSWQACMYMTGCPSYHLHHCLSCLSAHSAK
jgi:hypothetical protein